VEELRNKMKAVQDSKRYEHTLSVAYTAACLASIYGVDVEKAMRAGLLHDCAKCISNNELMELSRKYKILSSDVEKENPFLLHAKVGAVLAKEWYGESEQDILDAIRYYTTGRPGMNMLEKIIFTADYMEPGRTHAENLMMIRKLAFTDIDAAVIKILQDTLVYLKSGNEKIDPATEETFNYYLTKKEL